MNLLKEIQNLVTDRSINPILRERILLLKDSVVKLTDENGDLKKEVLCLKAEVRHLIEKLSQKEKEMKNYITQIEQNTVSDPDDKCPYCKKYTGQLLKIEPHKTYADAGFKTGFYECSNCHKQYDKEIGN